MSVYVQLMEKIFFSSITTNDVVSEIERRRRNRTREKRKIPMHCTVNIFPYIFIE